MVLHEVKNNFLFHGPQISNAFTGLFFSVAVKQFLADVVHLAAQAWPSCSGLLKTRWVRVSPFLIHSPLSSHISSFGNVCLAANQRGTRPPLFLCVFNCCLVRLRRKRPKPWRQRRRCSSLHTHLPPLSPSPPDLSFSSPTLLKGPHCDASQSVQNIPTSAPSPPPRHRYRYLSLWQPAIISASSATSVPAACLPLQSINSFQAALSGPKWRSRFSACHSDVNGFGRINKHWRSRYALHYVCFCAVGINHVFYCTFLPRKNYIQKQIKRYIVQQTILRKICYWIPQLPHQFPKMTPILRACEFYCERPPPFCSLAVLHMRFFWGWRVRPHKKEPRVFALSFLLI